MKRLFGLALVMLVVLWVPSSSLGQSATCQAYNPQSCIPSTGKPSGKDTLPFTGLDVPVLAGCGLLLIVAGVVSRRLSAPMP